MDLILSVRGLGRTGAYLTPYVLRTRSTVGMSVSALRAMACFQADTPRVPVDGFAFILHDLLMTRSDGVRSL